MTLKTLEQKIAEIDKSAEEQRRKAAREWAILAGLSPLIEAGGYNPPSIHFYELYGSQGGIHFKFNEFRLSTDQGKDPDGDLLAILLRTFPPVPVVKVSDGCVSFRPDLGVSYSTEQRPADEYECYGVTVRVETLHTPSARIDWYARLPITAEGELWRIEVAIPYHWTDFGPLTLRARHDRRTGRVLEWIECTLQPKWDAQRITWAATGIEYAKTFTLFWDRDSGAALDWPAVAFAKAPKPKAEQPAPEAGGGDHA